MSKKQQQKSEAPATSAAIPSAAPSPGTKEVEEQPSRTESKRREIAAEIARLRALADDIPEVVGSGARAGFVARKRECEDKIAVLQQQLRELTANRSVYVRLLGEVDDKLLVDLEVEGPSVIVDASQPYIDLAEAILPVCNKALTFDIPQYQRLVEVLQNWGRENQVLSMPRPRFELRSCGTMQGLVDHIRRAMEHETAFGGEYAAMVLRAEIDRDAAEKPLGDVVPVVVVNDASGFVTANLVAKGGRGGSTIDTTSLDTADAVEVVLGALESAAA